MLTSIPGTLSLTLLAGLLSAADPKDGLLLMNVEDLLHVRVVSGSRHEQRQIESPRSISVITREDIRRRNFRNIPDAIGSLAGIMTQYTNYGGGAPIIRGLVGNRILILIDGIRLNNAIFRLGPNQYLNTIDINRVERIEVVRGPGSVLYGSDALGGIINIITRSAASGGDSSEWRGALSARLSSQDRGVVTRAQIEGNLGRWSMTGGVSLKRFGDLRAGGVVGRQLHTGYDEAGGDLKVNYSFAKDRDLTLSIDHLQQEDVRRTDVLRAGTDRRFDWNPQLRRMFLAQYKHGRTGPFIDEWQLAFTSQYQHEDINRIAASRPSVLRLQNDRVRTEGVVWQATSNLGSRHLFTYGIDYYIDRVGSSRNDLNLLNGTRTAEKSTFADGSSSSSLAFFVQDEITLSPSLTANLRARFSQFHLNGTVTDAATGSLTADNIFSALTSGAYLSWRIKPGLFLVGGVGQAFRAPNIDDSTIIGSFSSGFEVPNAALKPERAMSYEMGLKYQGKRLSGTASTYLSRFRDLIDRAPGLYQDLPFLDSNGNGIRDAREELIFQRLNVGRARILGLELEGQLKLTATWSAWANASWIHGVDLLQRTPLTRIPPHKGESGLRWQANRRIYVEPSLFYAWRQTRLSNSDRADPRISRGGTPGFALVAVRFGADLGALGSLTMNFGNLTNRTYRFHGSGIDGPGRGLDLGLSRSF
jgi:hemoglobin/transferrin/lactoferrin receptor protein